MEVKGRPMNTKELCKPKCLDLFCGIGGLSLGLEAAGFDCFGGIDHWEDAAVTFEHNLHHSCMRADLRRVALTKIEEFFSLAASNIDIVAGGPPCQGYSTVGRRDEADPRNGLWLPFRDLVHQIRPAYVVMENVEGMLVMEDGRIRDAVIRSFAEIGYRMKCKLLRAADYGVPQLRKRAVFLGWLDGLRVPQFPPKSNGGHVSVGDAIFDLPTLEAGESATDYTSPPLTDYQRDRRKNVQHLSNHEAANHSPDLVEVIRHIPDGGNRKSIPDHLQPKSGFHNSYSRLASWKPAVAVTSNMRKPSSARAVHPRQHRGLTVREGLRLQSFDDDFTVLGSRTSQYLQVGNAVPPILALAIGREVLRAYRDNAADEIDAARRRRAIRLNPATTSGEQPGLFDALQAAEPQT
jgi:DNA (cytosine-5)-methyltransferase 1